MKKKDDYDIGGLIKSINKDGVCAKFLSEDSISNVSGYIQTGNYALNAVISGSLFGGIPIGRVTGLAGASGSGKTYLACSVIKRAQADGYRIFYFDSENALDNEFAERIGCDVDTIAHITAITIEETQTQASKILNWFIDKNKEIDEKNKSLTDEDKLPRAKCMIIIDSLGNLVSKKELDNTLSDNVAADMGLRAKTMGAMLRMVTNLSAAAGAPVLFTNHVYASMDMYPGLIQKQSGGSKVIYIASVLLQMTQVLNKTKDNKDADKSALANKTVGKRIHIMTTKNRFIVSELECDLELNYRTGLNPYSGLLDIAVACGFLTLKGPVYYLGEEKLGYSSTFDNKEFWDKHLEELDEIIKRETALSKELKDVPVITDEAKGE